MEPLGKLLGKPLGKPLGKLLGKLLGKPFWESAYGAIWSYMELYGAIMGTAKLLSRGFT